MDFYPKLAATALKLLTKRGRAVTLRQYFAGGGFYDPNSGASNNVGTPGNQDSIRRGVTTDAPGKRVGPQYGEVIEQNTLVGDNDKWIYLDANGPKPNLADHILFDNLNFSIVDIQEVNPGGVPLLYLLVLKAA